MTNQSPLQNVVEEFSGLNLGDSRLNKRLEKSVLAIAADPAKSFPKAMTGAELEGLYRLLNNDKVTFEKVFAPHQAATVRRVESHPLVLVAHDTTEFRFSEESVREGLGPMEKKGQGFFGHVALAMTPSRQALGILGVERWAREERVDGSPRPTQRERYNDPTKEPLRWGRLVNRVHEALGPYENVIHLMDREADDYDILVELRERRYVVRSSYDRRLANVEKQSLRPFMRTVDVMVNDRAATLSARTKKRPSKEIKKYPPRKPRQAILSISAAKVELKRPDKAAKSLPEILPMNVVHVSEPNPPDGADPIEWFLFTSEPIDTIEQVNQVVDFYCCR